MGQQHEFSAGKLSKLSNELAQSDASNNQANSQHDQAKETTTTAKEKQNLDQLFNRGAWSKARDNEAAAKKPESSGWDQASIIGKFFGFFAWPLFGIGRRGSLENEHLGPPPSADEAKLLWRNFDRRYAGSFFKTMLSLYKWRLLFVVFTQLVNGCLMAPCLGISIGKLVRDIGLINLNATQTTINSTIISEQITSSSPQITFDTITLDMLKLFALVWLTFLVNHWIYLESAHLSTKFRVGASRLIFAKSLKLSQVALSQATGAGQIVNLLTNDLQRFGQFAYQLSHLIRAPSQALITTIILIHLVGYQPVLAGLAGVACFLVLQGFLARLSGRFRQKTAKFTDKRVGVIHEIISSIRTIKMYAWEQPLIRLVDSVRGREMRFIGFNAILRIITETTFLSSVRVIAFIVFTTLVLMGQPLRPDVLFIAFGLITSMIYSITFDFQAAIISIIETLVSCNRIDKFLQADEMILKEKPISCATTKSASIKLTDISCSWQVNSTANEQADEQNQSSKRIIDKLSLTLASNEILLIVGRVGSGKTSLLLALLNELPLDSGHIEMRGRISYAPQAAWIFAGTIRENILLGQSYEPERYEQVVKACSLVRDFRALPAGDASVVGEQGVSLSGGQKARVNLARALYRRADIYLLDDPLSAVDGSVAKHIFRHAICGFLANKMVLLATHQMQFLQEAHKILILDRAESPAFGTMQQLSASGAIQKLDSQKQVDTNMLEGTKGQLTVDVSQSSFDLPAAPPGGGDNNAKDLGASKQKSDEYDDDEQRSIQNFTTSGAIKYYAKHAMNTRGFIMLIVFNLVARFMLEYNIYFLSNWSDTFYRREHASEQHPFEPQTWLDYLTTNELIGVYALIVLGIIVSSAVRAAQFYWSLIRASRSLHRRLFNSLIRAPISFFDFRPIGATLNRITRDMGYIDEILPSVLVDITCILHQVMGTMALIIWIDIENMVPCVIYVILVISLRKLTISAIIQLRHLEARARSPILSHVSTSLHGLTSIRAFSVQDQFLKQFDEHQNVHTSAWFANLASGCLAAALLNFLVLGFINAVIAYKIFVTLDSSNASTVGLIVIRLLCLPEPLDWAFRQLVEIESQLTSVQRIADYAELKPEEEPSKMDTLSCSKQGGAKYLAIDAGGASIEFDRVTLRYSPEKPPVLNSLSFTIRPGEKVGVVGRTGAGKSSLIAAIFRMYPFEGSIRIDNQDTKTLRLHKLRSSISIIPQDPVLFCGDLRRNLDPFDEHSDDDLWAALEAVQLKSVFANGQSSNGNSSCGLEFAIQSSGSNLSVGQRQLICLARAILRRNKVLVLDEATANVDPETDQFIQQTIRQQFKHCTVFTIAHRLLTIVDSDRVLVMEAGRVREFDTPLELSRNRDSLFSNMIDSNRSRQAARLRQLIEDTAATRMKEPDTNKLG